MGNVEQLKVQIDQLNLLEETWEQIRLNAVTVTVTARDARGFTGGTTWELAGNLVNGSKVNVIRASFELPQHESWGDAWQFDTRNLDPILKAGESRPYQKTLGTSDSRQEPGDVEVNSLSPVELMIDGMDRDVRKSDLQTQKSSTTKSLNDLLVRIAELEKCPSGITNSADNAWAR